MEEEHILEEYASVGDFSFPNFGAYPLQSSDCCTKTEMSSLDFDILESLETFEDLNLRVGRRCPSAEISESGS